MRTYPLPKEQQDYLLNVVADASERAWIVFRRQQERMKREREALSGLPRGLRRLLERKR
jgi:hypothetical protein